MPIDAPQPGFRQVAAVLRREIQEGKFAPGSVLPSEPELADRFEVTRSVVNRALAILRTEGLVRPQRGRGTTVNEIPVINRNAATRQRRDVREQGRGAFDAELRRLGLEPRSDLAQVGRVDAPADAAEALGIEAGAAVLIRRREMYANGKPVQLASSFVPWDIAEGTQLEQEDTGQGGLYSRLTDLGHEPKEFTEVVTVRPPTAEEARFLGMDEDQRVFVITRTAQSAGGRAVEVCIHVMPAHQWSLTYTWSAS